MEEQDEQLADFERALEAKTNPQDIKADFRHYRKSAEEKVAQLRKKNEQLKKDHDQKLDLLLRKLAVAENEAAKLQEENKHLRETADAIHRQSGWATQEAGEEDEEQRQPLQQNEYQEAKEAKGKEKESNECQQFCQAFQQPPMNMRVNGKRKNSGEELLNNPAKPRQIAKCGVVSQYFKRWLREHVQHNHKTLVYCDAFAGRGKYDNSNDPSNVVESAAFSIISAASQLMSCGEVTLHMVLIEKTRNNWKDLCTAVCDKLQMDQQPIGGKVLPVKKVYDNSLILRIKVIQSKCEAASGHLSHYPCNYPLFAFFDPFGWSGYSKSFINFLRHHFSWCDILVNFMSSSIDRFRTSAKQQKSFVRMTSFSNGLNQFITVQDQDFKTRVEEYCNQYFNAVNDTNNHCLYPVRLAVRRTPNAPLYHLLFLSVSQQARMMMKATILEEACWYDNKQGVVVFDEKQQKYNLDKQSCIEHAARLIKKQFGQNLGDIPAMQRFVMEETPFNWCNQLVEAACKTCTSHNQSQLSFKPARKHTHKPACKNNEGSSSSASHQCSSLDQRNGFGSSKRHKTSATRDGPRPVLVHPVNGYGCLCFALVLATPFQNRPIPQNGKTTIVFQQDGFLFQRTKSVAVQDVDFKTRVEEYCKLYFNAVNDITDDCRLYPVRLAVRHVEQ
ncbi:hypothetical protein QOT17_000938 [Balamuthia mandrillaris]